MVQGLRLLEFGGISKPCRYSIQEVVINLGFIFKLKKYAAESDFILVKYTESLGYAFEELKGSLLWKI